MFYQLFFDKIIIKIENPKRKMFYDKVENMQIRCFSYMTTQQ